MNLFTRTLALCLLTTASPWALAASSVDLTVKGLITPSACTPQLSSGGNVDLGKTAFKDLNPTKMTVLPRVRLQLNVVCDAQTLMALQPTDNRADSGDEATYGIGFASNGQRLGGFYLAFGYPTADGSLVDSVSSHNGGSSWTWLDAEDAWQPNYMAAPSLHAVMAPIPVQNLSTEISVIPYILRSDRLPGSEEIPIDGAATITVRYL